MLNRRHIRLKAMQVLFMHQQSGREMSIKQLQSAFVKNVESMEKLYLYYLAFLREIDHQAFLFNQDLKNRYTEDTRDESEHLAIRNNPSMRKLAEDEELSKYLEKEGVYFNHDVGDDVAKKVYLDVRKSDIYKDYAALGEKVASHGDLLLHIVKHYTDNYELFEQHLEDEFTNFQDDRKLVIGMVKKTLQNLQQGKEPYLIEFIQDEENTTEFGHHLIKTVIENELELHQIIEQKILKWEPGQVAVIDRVILKMGIAEFKYFSSIPKNVTINEYVELAKGYSPPNSKKFINGVLDSVSREMAD